MPDKVFLVIQGQITVYSHHPQNGIEIERDKNAVVHKIYPGSRVQTLIQKGEYGKAFLQQDISSENTELFGIECDLLGITSPYSYIASSPVYAYEIPFEAMFKTLLDLNPAGLISLKK